MTSSKWFSRISGAAIILLITGCSPAYRAYPGCCVDCTYCAPPPLPYTQYDPCVCHACVAEKYLNQDLPTVDHEDEDISDDKEMGHSMGTDPMPHPN